MDIMTIPSKTVVFYHILVLANFEILLKASTYQPFTIYNQLTNHLDTDPPTGYH